MAWGQSTVMSVLGDWAVCVGDCAVCVGDCAVYVGDCAVRVGDCALCVGDCALCVGDGAVCVIDMSLYINVQQTSYLKFVRDTMQMYCSSNYRGTC